MSGELTPQETVERALALTSSGASAGDRVVISEETSTANLRWAGNTLTTNGVSRSRQLTVIAVDRRADGTAGVENGIYILGDKSWSIDMQRYNFQFTGQRFFRIRNGRLDGQLRDVAYQATTTDFWGSMEAVGGPQTYVLGGAFNCGKGQPGQVAPVSHGCPAALMRGVRILNTAEEGAA